LTENLQVRIGGFKTPNQDIFVTDLLTRLLHVFNYSVVTEAN